MVPNEQAQSTFARAVTPPYRLVTPASLMKGRIGSDINQSSCCDVEAMEGRQLIAWLGRMHQLSRIQSDAALWEAAGNEEVIRKIREIVYTRLHIGIVDI